MMHYHPELVDIERAGDGRSEPFAVESLNDRTAWVPRDWNRVSEDTGIGNPLKSSPEKGARYAEAGRRPAGAVVRRPRRARRHLRRATPGKQIVFNGFVRNFS